MTVYTVVGTPLTPTEANASEIFTEDQMTAILLVAANIADIQFLADNLSTIAAAVAADAATASGAAADALAARVAAEAAQVAAAGSATAAGTSATTAGTSATAATASATAAAISAAAAQAAVDSIGGGSGLVPVGGSTSQALRKNTNADYDYSFQPDPVLDIANIGRINLTGLADGFTFVYNLGTDTFGVAAPSAATTFAGLSDVDSIAPQEGQFVVYSGTTGKYENRTVATGGGTSGFIGKRTGGDLLGTGEHLFAAADIGKLLTIDVAAGGYTLKFDDQVTCPADSVIEAVALILNSTTGRGVTFTGASAISPVPTVNPTVLAANATTGVNGSPLTNAQNVAKAVTIPAGNNVVVYVLYAANPANTAADSESPSFDFAGQTNIPWDIVDDDAIAAPRLHLAAVALGTLASPLVTTFKPDWVDYGGNGNVNAYEALFIVTTDADQDNPLGNAVLDQKAAGASAVTVSVTTSPGQANRVAIYGAIRRGNAGAAAITVQVGTATQIFEGSSGTALNQSNVRAAVATEAIGMDRTESATFDLVNTSNHSVFSFTVVPVGGTMVVAGRGNVLNPVVTRDGLVGIVYDPNRQRVDIGT